MILFYGNECPHCKDLEKFIEQNNIAEKVKFDYLEVWHSKANSRIMMEKAKECEISQDRLGVPFLYVKGKCFIGGPEVEKFFRQEVGM
jgi:glutaredoxin